MNVLLGIMSVDLVTTETLFLLQRDLCGADYSYQCKLFLAVLALEIYLFLFYDNWTSESQEWL